MKRIYAMLLCAVLATSLVLPAYASETPSEIEAAGAALRERGIYQGDESGNLQLGRGLNRAELAMILARLDGGVDEDLDWYDWACYFTDVPGWAKGCVGYCVMGGLLKGYGDQRFGASDPVTPNVASTVVLRACGYGSGEEVNWDYKTAASYAVSQGLLSQSTAQAAVITRGELAVLIHRALERRRTVPISMSPRRSPASTGSVRTTGAGRTSPGRPTPPSSPASMTGRSTIPSGRRLWTGGRRTARETAAPTPWCLRITTAKSCR